MTVYSYSLPYLLVAGYPLLVAGHVLAVALHAVRRSP